MTVPVCIPCDRLKNQGHSFQASSLFSYSREHAICDCYVFGALRKAVGGKTCQFNEEVQDVVT